MWFLLSASFLHGEQAHRHKGHIVVIGAIGNLNLLFPVLLPSTRCSTGRPHLWKLILAVWLMVVYQLYMEILHHIHHIPFPLPHHCCGDLAVCIALESWTVDTWITAMGQIPGWIGSTWRMSNNKAIVWWATEILFNHGITEISWPIQVKSTLTFPSILFFAGKAGFDYSFLFSERPRGAWMQSDHVSEWFITPVWP